MSFYKFEGMGDISNYFNYVKVHWIVSFKDALITVCLYLVVGVLMRNMLWGRRFNGKRLATILVLGGLWSIAIEYYAINIAHRWAYAPNMLLLPLLNVGILPVLQMIVIPIVAVLMSRSYLKP